MPKSLPGLHGLRAVVATNRSGEISGVDVLRSREVPRTKKVRAAVLELDAARERAWNIVEVGACDADERQRPGDAGTVGQELRAKGRIVDLLDTGVAVEGENRGSTGGLAHHHVLRFHADGAVANARGRDRGADKQVRGLRLLRCERAVRNPIRLRR